MEWQPIKTAPKDGKIVIIYCPEENTHINLGFFYESELGDSDWYRIGFSGSVSPTYWMPLPTPPKESAGE